MAFKQFSQILDSAKSRLEVRNTLTLCQVGNFFDIGATHKLILKIFDLHKKNDIWISAIADMYVKNPSYLLNAMAGMYQLYHLNIRSRTSIKSLRSETIGWLVDNCGVTKDEWHKKWLKATDVHNLLINWSQEWESRNGMATGGCNEAPLPGSDFFRILASDVDKFAMSPSLGYKPI